ncbi:MAG: carboxypeptidase-like regulatory domain-containing protein, partial [Phaeodactylibacter sp.]|nr:carboxypeptidase-like regulatory domain-containing protein [Phaeodactylibacter sp.]
MMKKLLLIPLLFITLLAFAQEKYTLSGYVRDVATGEDLVGASVLVQMPGGQGTTTNAYGFYSLQLPAGQYQLAFTYLGYQSETEAVNLDQDIRLNVDLKEETLQLEEVVVTAREDDENVRSTEMGTVGLAMDNVRKLPALMGEVDVLKTIQLLPGVLSAGEGTSGFYVRGGGPDQNLVLLDEAVVYNSGHLLGFFSVFNA